MIPNKGTTMQWMNTRNRKANSALLFVFCLVVTPAFFVNHAVAAAQVEWEIKKAKKGITVSTRKTASGYKEVKATVTANATIQDFLALLDNTAIAPQWVDHCEKIELLAMPSDYERVVKTSFSAPWPVKDREMVTYSLTQFDEVNNIASIAISDASDNHPQTSSKIRMQGVKGKWTLITLDANSLSITYEGYGEPAGKMPKWLANRLVVTSTYKTFKNLRTTLEQVE